ncbi:HsdS2 [Desulforapulum autotrophicum HRM2]|uniref:HsdS2 n=1 Tax=Desulforapulum autotrophicum (strain ATCC 43914 / DSM 3382 / VKM B-1955 / HRM2) TaxID=177437 RepID=C0QCH4_DESAH|nr:restriction endonuclease subunit S [Desulforapulum autotrophicum]ACN15051.1 HsdS2 [Desulforapulum autotrophicum HRM2]
MEQREGYKKTKIGWIPEDWDCVKLGGIVNKVGSGITPRGGSKVYCDKGVPFFRSQNILHGTVSVKDIVYISENLHQKMKNTHLQPADVLLNITGASIGRCCVFPNNFKKGNVNQHVCIIRPDGTIKSQYLCSLLNSPIGQKQIWNFQAGGNREGLNFQQIRSFILPLPPLPEQQKIADVLSTVDDKISSIDQQIQQTEQLKKGLMEKLLTEGIGHTEFKDTEIGQIPASWDVVKLKTICHRIFVGIATSTSEHYTNDGIPIIRNQNIKENSISGDDLLKITNDFNEKNHSKKLMVGDIITARTGYPGMSCVIPKKFEGAQTFTTLVSRPNKERIFPHYLSRYINSDIGKKIVLSNQAGGAQQNLNAGRLKEIPIILPPLEEQKQIATILSSVDDKIDVLRSKKTSYTTLKKGLMGQLLTGQMRVKI